MALALAYRIARGEDLIGRRIHRSAVLYVGLEGQAGLEKRIAAASKEYGPAGRLFARFTLPVLPSQADGDTGTSEIVAASNRLALQAGHAVGLVIIDTLARAMSGDDENAAKDMAAFIERRAAAISKQTGAAVLLVHHSGKDASKGLRGNSALFAACDAVIRIDDTRGLELEKVKDGEPGPLCSYTLRSVSLGTDDDGDPITTCVVDLNAATKSPKSVAKRMTKPALAALRELQRVYETEARTVDKGVIGGAELPTGHKVVSMDAWRNACVQAKLSADGAKEAEKKAFGRAFAALEEADKVARCGDYVWTIVPALFRRGK